LRVLDFLGFVLGSFFFCGLLLVGFEFKGLGPCGSDWVSFCGLVWFFLCILSCVFRDDLRFLIKHFLLVKKEKEKEQALVLLRDLQEVQNS
jgi:hypothetical protein